MRLIDADVLMADFQKAFPNFDVKSSHAKALLATAPTVDAEPVKHGRWIEEGLVDGNQNRYCRCSECGKGDTQAISQKVPYCWWCGARMDGGENGAN